MRGPSPYTRQAVSTGERIACGQGAVSFTGQTTWFPDLEESDDYRFQGHVNVQAALNKHLGVRVGYDLKYDNEPVRGFERMDTSTTASLVVQLGRK